MSNSIQVAGSLLPNNTNTPLDARSVVDTETDIANIQVPYIGMLIYVKDTGVTYQVKSLKAGTVNGVDIPNLSVDKYDKFGVSISGDTSGGTTGTVVGDLKEFNVVVDGLNCASINVEPGYLYIIPQPLAGDLATITINSIQSSAAESVITFHTGTITKLILPAGTPVTGPTYFMPYTDYIMSISLGKVTLAPMTSVSSIDTINSASVDAEL